MRSLKNIRRTIYLTLAVCAAITLSSCATSPEGRSQLKLLPDEQINSMGVQSFEQIKQDTPETKNENMDKFDDFFVCTANQY